MGDFFGTLPENSLGSNWAAGPEVKEEQNRQVCGLGFGQHFSLPQPPCPIPGPNPQSLTPRPFISAVSESAPPQAGVSRSIHGLPGVPPNERTEEDVTRYHVSAQSSKLCPLCFLGEIFLLLHSAPPPPGSKHPIICSLLSGELGGSQGVTSVAKRRFPVRSLAEGDFSVV